MFCHAELGSASANYNPNLLVFQHNNCFSFVSLGVHWLSQTAFVVHCGCYWGLKSPMWGGVYSKPHHKWRGYTIINTETVAQTFLSVLHKKKTNHLVVSTCILLCGLCDFAWECF